MRPSSCLVVSVLAAVFLAADVRPGRRVQLRRAACHRARPSPRRPIVFVGDVMSVETVGGDFHMRLRVVRALKGIEAATADLWSSATTSCGVKLDQGKRYVIYTDRVSGRMTLHACGYGRAVTTGEPDPELPPVPGRVYGRVTRYDVDRIREFQSLVPIPSVRISLDRPAGRVTATSDQWGRFQFADVPPGTYQLAVDAGPGLTPWMPGSVVMPDREACVDTRIVLRPAGKVTGRVQTADGKPGRGIYVRLLPDGPAGSRLAQLVDLGRTTGDDGRFTFEGLRPDNYVLAVNPEGIDATGRHPYAPVWFGGADCASATRIPLAEGAAIELDRPFVLKAALPTRTFTVAVTCRDGSVPAALTTARLRRTAPSSPSSRRRETVRSAR